MVMLVLLQLFYCFYKKILKHNPLKKIVVKNYEKKKYFYQHFITFETL